MRAARVGAGGAAALRPSSGMLRLVEAVGDLLAPREAVSFAPVEGVFRAENETEDGAGPHDVRRVEQPRQTEAIRLYNHRGAATYAYVGPVGQRLSVRV